MLPVDFIMKFQTHLQSHRCVTCKGDIWQHFSRRIQTSVDISPPTKKVPCVARAHKLMCGCQDCFMCQLWQLTDKMGTHSRGWLASNARRLPRGLFSQNTRIVFQQHKWKLKWAFRASTQLRWNGDYERCVVDSGAKILVTTAHKTSGCSEPLGLLLWACLSYRMLGVLMNRTK